MSQSSGDSYARISQSVVFEDSISDYTGVLPKDRFPVTTLASVLETELVTMHFNMCSQMILLPINSNYSSV